MSGTVSVCSGGVSPSPVTVYRPWLAADFSATRIEFRQFFNGTGFTSTTQSDGRFGVYIASPNASPSVQDVIDEFNLSQFNQVVVGGLFTVSGASGVLYEYRNFLGHTSTVSDGINPPTFQSNPYVTTPSNARTSWQFLAATPLPSQLGICNGTGSIPGTATVYTRADSGGPENYTGFYESVTPGPVNDAITRINIAVAVTQHRGLTDFPAAWSGPSNFNVCQPGSPFVPFPTPAPSTAPGNDAMIEAMLAADPLRNCRTCGP